LLNNVENKIVGYGILLVSNGKKWDTFCY
jgi:hypothetical protein